MSCPACFTGAVRHDEKPTGRETKIHGRDTYVAEPPQGVKPNGIIVIVPDAFGWQFINNKILADNYASKGGFLVYLPEFMDGYAAPLWMIQTMGSATSIKTNMDIVTWPWNFGWTVYGFVPFLIRNRFSVSMPKVTSFLAAVRANEGSALPIGVAGFCWGGLHAITLASGIEEGGKPLSDAHFTAHPSNLSIPSDIEKIKKPTSIAIGDKDFVMPMSQVTQTEGLLKKIEGAHTEIVVYPGAGHGFSVRADWGNEKQSEQAKQAEEQAIKFFTETFKTVTF